jgi:DNA-binding NarL/FixJ family response regulator
MLDAMSKHRFLLVDDDGGVRRRVRELLLEEYPTAAFVEAGTAEEALAFAAESAPTLILLDCQMPGRSGLNALPDLLARRPGVPIVMVSGEAPEAYGPAALRAGAAAFVSKERGLDDLLPVLRTLSL